VNCRVIAIDPGTQKSAFLVWDGIKVVHAEIMPNEEVRDILVEQHIATCPHLLAIEWIASYGMAVGAEVFETCMWVGRFAECWLRRTDTLPTLVKRAEVKMHHCHSMKAKDANIRQALIDKYGPPGTKKAQGITYGIGTHLWSALAIATYITESYKLEAA
jgi:hypothetical protein